MAESNAKAEAWRLFDRILAQAKSEGRYTNPWETGEYEPDIRVLEKLLGAALGTEGASSQSGVPALALDVWVAYELRRAGFDDDAVWPRASSPRIVPTSITSLIDALPVREAKSLRDRIEGPNPPSGVVSASASILGKNYFKQVDVIMSDWRTGPEILISTKRMDSSFGKNAANRVEESYGDAKNLRGRHPLAALGFVYGLRSTILDTEPAAARWLIDLLEKLGREDDAYDAVCLLMVKYSDAVAPVDSDGATDDSDALEDAGVIQHDSQQHGISTSSLAEAELDARIDALPVVTVLRDTVPPSLDPGRFLEAIVDHVLNTSPITLHGEARRRAGRPFVSPRTRGARKSQGLLE